MDRPILFSAPMVRAILEGRKGMTRRVIKLQPDEDGLAFDLEREQWMDTSERVYKCPYGRQGDIFYVRETWATAVGWDDKPPRELWGKGLPFWYAADGAKIFTGAKTGGPAFLVRGRNRPSIHMPRFASRLTLKITNIRAERLQDISREDAKAEGIPEHYSEALGVFGEKMLSDRALHFWDNHTSVENFQWLWDSINGKPRNNGVDISWQVNPYVWVVSFEKMEGNHVR